MFPSKQTREADESCFSNWDTFPKVEISNVKLNPQLTFIFGFKSFNSFKAAFVRSAYISLCDQLMNVHVSQSQNHLSTLSNNGAVGSCALLL